MSAFNPKSIEEAKATYKGLRRSAIKPKASNSARNGSLQLRVSARSAKAISSARGGNAAQPAIRKGLRAIGKKGSEWLKVRAWLKRHFNYAGITSCEFQFRFAGVRCWGDNGLSFAHCKKRRKLEEGEIWHVALACQACHTCLDEHLSHEEMHKEVHRVIDRRGLIAPKEVVETYELAMKEKR